MSSPSPGAPDPSELSLSAYAPIHKQLSSPDFLHAHICESSCSFHEILTLAQRRREFHRHLAFDTYEKTLDYQQLRAIAVDFGNPLRPFATNAV
jgi:hypothetical protein